MVFIINKFGEQVYITDSKVWFPQDPQEVTSFTNTSALCFKFSQILLLCYLLFPESILPQGYLLGWLKMECHKRNFPNANYIWFCCNHGLCDEYNIYWSYFYWIHKFVRITGVVIMTVTHFPGLRSRWTIFLKCRNCKPVKWYQMQFFWWIFQKIPI